ncbi:inactive N-acetylated-alpha-linked acidic dipeptidase-like protein 2 [Polyodon spathula]|uniref:inactive N-acetylated-alpha-linked acidic dipeptidase-like protein 2 n=1 Tax=Polyodon spathula TaxID=7913 RepID=UPI001B7E69DF|nr:inactive N-acetylated-alpha-linked acidic dipeptidase-like protein 2 [Polyodon spathula]
MGTSLITGSVDSCFRHKGIEKQGFYTSAPLQAPGKDMAYRKVTADHSMPLHSRDLENEDLPATALELEWDMEKELEEPHFDQFQLDNIDHHHLGNSTQSTDLDMEPIQVSVSPQGRFERLQEDPDYLSHYTRQAPKSNRTNWLKVAKYFCVGSCLFISGLLISYYVRKTCRSDIFPNNEATQGPPSTSSDLYQNVIQKIRAKNIEIHFRDFKQLSDKEEDTSIARSLAERWTELGLTDVHLVNYTVLLSLPGSTPNTITDKDRGLCFLPNGKPCDADTKHDHIDQLYSYAAYSAKGVLEAEVIDVQYGTLDDLIQAHAATNVANKIALLKLGHVPLLYKLSLLAEAGFGGVLPYVDPCDQPNDKHFLEKAFGITLNTGGDPSTPGYPGIDGVYHENQLNLTTLLVQPISASLAKQLLSAPGTGADVRCIPLAMPVTSAKRTITLHIKSNTKYRTIHNVIGYLKGITNPDRYVLVGSHHDSWYDKNGGEWISGAAINTELIGSLVTQVRNGWQPDRTTVFCSWGGSAFGNIGSYEWTEEMREVLESNAVAYVSLYNPVRGNGSLHAIASPSLQQLAAEAINKRLSLNCTRRGKCSPPDVSSVQTQGDVDFFANQLGIPTIEFAYQETKTGEKQSFLSEALFPVDSSETLDPSFNVHETVAKLTGEALLLMVNEPVLPFSALDVVLDVQNKLRDDKFTSDQLLAFAGTLRETAQLFQSDEMRPANDPKERDTMHVRMLNDVLQDLEKNFIIPQAPLGFYRNILYALDERTPQFSILKEAQDRGKPNHLNKTVNMVLNCMNSAQKHIETGLDLFENVPKRKN